MNWHNKSLSKIASNRPSTKNPATKGQAALRPATTPFIHIEETAAPGNIDSKKIRLPENPSDSDSVVTGKPQTSVTIFRLCHAEIIDIIAKLPTLDRQAI